jgi:4-amino-4-deoxy-L-arabinose transferase-like glycosyltransferase
MIPIRRFGAVDLVLFLYVVAMAGGIRAGYLMLSADNGNKPGPLVVQDPANEADLRALAASVKDGNAFRSTAPLAAGPEDTAHASPGYPWLLGLLGRAIPADKLDLVVRWGQCGLGALTAGLYFLFARRAFRSLGVGVMAGILCALHPFWVVDTAQIDDGVLVTFAVALALFSGVRASQTGGPFASLLYGLALAAAALVRAALLPFAFVGLAWFLLRTRRLASGWLGALLAFLGFVIGVAPWSVRNWQTFNEPTPIVDSAYLHVWMGNNRDADGGPVDPAKVLPADQVESLKGKKQTERYGGKDMVRIVWDEMRRDPPAVAQHRLQAGLAFLFGAPATEAGRMRVVDAATTDDQKTLLSYEVLFFWTLLGMIAFGLLGWRWSFGWAAESTPAALAMIWIPLPYILSHAEALSGPRLPLDGVLLSYAAFALLCFVPVVRRYLLGGAAAATGPQPH